MIDGISPTCIRCGREGISFRKNRKNRNQRASTDDGHEMRKSAPLHYKTKENNERKVGRKGHALALFKKAAFL